MTLEELLSIPKAKQRRKYVSKVKDENILVEIFKRDSNYGVKLQALLRIKDEKRLCDLYHSNDYETDLFLKEEIIQRVSKPEYLFQIYITEKHNEELREKCIEKIYDKEILKKLLGRESNHKLILLLNERMRDIPNTVSFLWEDD
jgi:hypothetical protein